MKVKELIRELLECSNESEVGIVIESGRSCLSGSKSIKVNEEDGMVTICGDEDWNE